MHPVPLHPRAGLGATLVVLFAAILPSESAAQTDSSLSFFITGRAIGQGGNLGGLSGADAHCQLLADSVGAGMKLWRAYLSTQAAGGAPAVNARDRIGSGPWFNADKVMIAADLAALHDTANRATVTGATGLTHRGATVASNRHDIITGTRFDGMAPAAGADSTCANWTSSATFASAAVRTIMGHHNRQGISSNIIAHSWNQAHVSAGCSQANVEAGGGSGFFYCFADNTPVGIDLRRLPERAGAAGGHAPYYLTANGRGEEIVYRFELDRESRVEVTVHDLEGRRRAVLTRGVFGAGGQAVRWNGTDANGARLPAGLYVIALKREGRNP